MREYKGRLFVGLLERKEGNRGQAVAAIGRRGSCLLSTS